jgi:predicted permease
MGLGTAFADVGFVGIPVTQLAFGSEDLLRRSVLTAMMTIPACTLGVWLSSPGAGFARELRLAFESPLIPSVVIGLALRNFEVELQRYRANRSSSWARSPRQWRSTPSAPRSRRRGRCASSPCRSSSCRPFSALIFRCWSRLSA